MNDLNGLCLDKERNFMYYKLNKWYIYNQLLTE